MSATFSLVGSPSGNGAADLGIQFKVKNTSGTSTNFHFFEYANFVLGNTPSDTVQFLNSNAVFQVGNLGSVTENAAATGGSGFPAPMHHEAGVVFDTLNKLTGGTPVFLSDTNFAGPGDVTWAFEWDLPINAGNSSLFSKDISVLIPEPSSVSLVAAGIAGLCLLRRRRKS